MTTTTGKTWWNYSTDGDPRHPYNWTHGTWYPSRATGGRHAKAWCRSEGVTFDEGMVGEITDLVGAASRGRG